MMDFIVEIIAEDYIAEFSYISENISWLGLLLKGVMSSIPIVFFIVALAFMKLYNNKNPEYVRGFFYVCLLLGGALWVINIR